MTYHARQQEAQLLLAVADRTAYDVRHTGKLSNKFRLHVYERLIRTIRFNGQGLRTHPNCLLKRDHWPWQTKVQ